MFRDNRYAIRFQIENRHIKFKYLILSSLVSLIMIFDFASINILVSTALVVMYMVLGILWLVITTIAA